MLRAHMDRRKFLQISTLAVGGAAAAWPQAGAAREKPQVCPKSAPPAKTLVVFRPGEISTRAWDVSLTVSCLQGIVNRVAPRLYLIHDRYDELWLEWLRERGDVQDIRPVGIAELFEQFLPAVKQMYVTDPAVPASINAATMLAAVRGGLVVTPELSDQFDLPLGIAPDSSQMGLDLRTLGWKKDIDAYRWVYNEIGSALSRKALAILDPKETALRDYLIEFRIPILWIAGRDDTETNPAASPAEEKEFAREIMMKWPPNIPCFGWPSSGYKQGGIGETPGVQLMSQCAKFSVCTAYDGYSPTVGNLSVHSGTTAILKQSTRDAVPQPGKVYYAFIRSDGDGWNFQRHYYRKLFDDPRHGTVPIGWQVGPTAMDGQPDILDYYYKKARPGDYFVNALSGVGYIHEDDYAANYPPEQQEEIWRGYIELSEHYLAGIDTRILATYSEMKPERRKMFAGMFGVRGILGNYARSHQTNLSNLVEEVEGVPWFRAANSSPESFTFTPWAQQSAVSFMVDEIRRWTPKSRPAFLYIFLANWLTDMGMAESIARELGGDYLAVRADELASLYTQYRAKSVAAGGSL